VVAPRLAPIRSVLSLLASARCGSLHPSDYCRDSPCTELYTSMLRRTSLLFFIHLDLMREQKVERMLRTPVDGVAYIKSHIIPQPACPVFIGI
jgi:hypothetical protein